MSLIALLAKAYIVVLITRWILTQQELMYNPIGRSVAKITDPLFKRQSHMLKSDTDRLIPFYIAAICLLFGIINGLVDSNMLLGVIVGISSLLRFIAMFFIVCLIVGSVSVPGAGSIPVFFFRIGGIWVNAIRKVVQVRSNKIIIPAILLIVVVFAAFDMGIKAFGRLLLGVPITMTLVTESLLSFVYSFAGLLNVLMIVLVVRAVMSWFSPDPRNALVQLIYYVTEPLLAPVRRVLPSFGGFDLSVLVVMLLIGLVRGMVYKILSGQVFVI